MKKYQLRGSRKVSTTGEIDKAEEFLANNNNNNNNINKKLNLMLHGGCFLKSVSCKSIYNHEDGDAEQKNHPPPLLNEFISHKMHHFTVVGSCDGLLLVVASSGFSFDGGDKIYIWNPTTNEHKVLPPLATHWYGNFVYGFGRDLNLNNNNYKVLLLETVRSEESSDEWSVDTYKINMYTTATNSWKQLHQNLGPYGFLRQFPFGMILAYNNLHHVPTKCTTKPSKLPYKEIILSFDLKNDKFVVRRKVPSGNFLQLCNLNGDLCATSYAEKGLCNLWRMENFGVKKKECWTKICSIDPHLGMDKPLCHISALHVGDDCQILFHAVDRSSRKYVAKHFIVSYHTKNKKASLLVSDDGPFWSIPVVYEESFISPNAASTVEEELSVRQPSRKRAYMEGFTKDALSPTSS